MSPEQALAEALAMDVSSTPTPPCGLTTREQQVAQLVCVGESSRDIARRLVISEGTVRVRLEHIFRKLDVHSRAELAAWGSRQFG
ncbi:MAG: helix-turn-helix transcriptional regulator [Chloroflexi bacterium]|nr:helix-turn-helix transcriptional regulator [Chloroflexota bacterium]